MPWYVYLIIVIHYLQNYFPDVAYSHIKLFTGVYQEYNERVQIFEVSVVFIVLLKNNGKIEETKGAHSEMYNFLIGMHGKFDDAKYQRDFRPGFWGVEACMFPDEQEVDKLVGKTMEDGFRFGVHYPLVKKDTPYRDPFLIALSANEREKAWECFEKEVLFASGKGAAYILTHFPKPVLVNRSLDLSYWRFAGNKEWIFMDEYPLEALKENLGIMFKRLSDLSDRYGIKIFLENDAMPAVLTESMFLVDLLKDNDEIKLCLDIGRLHLQEKLDPSFNAMEFVEIMAPYTGHIHLWNTNPAGNLSGGHYPVLPKQKPSEGWADVKRFIDTIKRYNSKVKVLFEHRSDLVNDEELDECYRWVEELFGGQLEFSGSLRAKK